MKPRETEKPRENSLLRWKSQFVNRNWISRYFPDRDFLHCFALLRRSQSLRFFTLQTGPVHFHRDHAHTIIIHQIFPWLSPTFFQNFTELRKNLSIERNFPSTSIGGFLLPIQLHDPLLVSQILHAGFPSDRFTYARREIYEKKKSPDRGP